MATTALAAFSFSSTANAQSFVDAANVSDLSDEQINAAAAVKVEYNDEGDVTSLSAASAFGGQGAAAIATQFSAASLGSSESYGSIAEPLIDGSGFVNIAVEFGSDSYDDGFHDGFHDGEGIGYDGGYNDGYDDGLEDGLEDGMPASDGGFDITDFFLN